jgi:signal transduction histidine kinase
LPERGPEEVRRTTAAFNAMQERLHRFIDDRTRLLAAISHDLRTPITTLRLRAEFVEDEETRARILATLDEMQRMVEATLAFASEQASRDATRTVDLVGLVESVVGELVDLGADVQLEPSGRLPYPCRPTALTRALRNLVENAVRYGERARVRVVSDAAGVAIVVEDDGPGIAQDQIEAAFAPFVRLEGSRSPDTGGIGLGLAIARTIARAHGGDVTLANRTGGGLAATLSLPPVPS